MCIIYYKVYYIVHYSIKLASGSLSPQDDESETDVDGNLIKGVLCAGLQKTPEKGTIQKNLEAHFEQACVPASTGATGETDQVAALTDAMAKLQRKMEQQDAIMKQQADELEAMKQAKASEASQSMQAAASAPTKPVSASSEPIHDSMDTDQEPDGPTFEAGKQRLRRLCRPRKDGTIPASENVLAEWKKQGKDRTNLIKLFLEKGCDEDPWSKEAQKCPVAPYAPHRST